MIVLACLPSLAHLASFSSLPLNYLLIVANPLAFVLLQSPPRSSIGQSLRSGDDVITPWGKITHLGQVGKKERVFYILLSQYSVLYSPLWEGDVN